MPAFPRRFALLSCLLSGLLAALACSSGGSSGDEDTAATKTDDGDGTEDGAGPGAAPARSGDAGAPPASGDDAPSSGEDDSIPIDSVPADSVPIEGDSQPATPDPELNDPSVPALPPYVEIATNPDGTLQILCGSAPCACSDGLDNDGDGLVDGQDSECTGPFDDDESSFATGIPGDNRDPKWQDCFFDGNSGAGDDGCRYHTDCLTGVRDADDRDCQLSDQCREFCQPLTPPGCDCFGCCEVSTEDGATVHIVLANTCSLAAIDDERACPRCMPSLDCANECGECEICLGKSLADLPESCAPTPPPDSPPGTGGSGGSTSDPPGSGGAGGSGGSTTPPTTPPSNRCDDGLTACLETADCPTNSYCSLGCCRPHFTVR